jgi:hypothetical protein
MTTIPYIQELFDLLKNYIRTKNDKEKFIYNFVKKSFENKDNISNLFKEPLEDFPDNFNFTSLTNLNDLFKYKYDNENKFNNIEYKFGFLIYKINKIIKNSFINEFIEFNSISLTNYNNKIAEIFNKTNEEILKKTREIYNKDKKIFKKEKLTKKENNIIVSGNKEDFKNEIEEFIKNINNLINLYDNEFDTKLINIKDTTNLIKETDDFSEQSFKYFLNNYINKFIKEFKKTLKKEINSNEFIKELLEFFKKTEDFKYPPLKIVIEDLENKYKNFGIEIDNINDINDLLYYEELFNTNNGDWINDSKKDVKIKELKKKYDDTLLKLTPEKIEINKEFEELYLYSEKIKEIKAKLDNKEKLQKKELSFISESDSYIKKIENNSEYKSNKEFKEQVDLLKRAINEIKIDDVKIKDKVIDENKDKRIIDDVISKEEKEKNTETVYLEDHIQFFKIALKFFTYGAIFFTFIVLFISILGILVLIYNIIYNSIKLLVNSANSTNNLSLDYNSKSIIKCGKNNYSNDTFYLLTEQKQSLSIFNLGAYTIYLLIIYFVVYFSLLFYSKIMKFTFVGSLYDIDKNFIYLFMIGVLIVYSLIHLLIFKYLYKPYVYIPYKIIDNEEKNIDKIIFDLIIVKNEQGQNIRFDDFFDLLYDASKIEELSDYFLKEIKNEDNEGCLTQKIIIYNLYEYLRQYINFDEDFKYNFKQYCSTNEKNKPKYNNGDEITFISMLKKNEIKIISNYHEELNFVNKLEDTDIEFYNKLNTYISNKIKDINKKIITHNKTSLPFFITIIYMIFIFILNFVIVYFIISKIIDDKTDAYHNYFKLISKFLDDNIYKNIFNYFKYK